MPTPLIPLLGAVILGTWAIRYARTRSRLRELAWPAEKAARLREIREAIERAALLQNVDPWGELAANQVEQLSERFREFEHLVVRRFRGEWPRGREVHESGARAFWAELNRLERLSTLLQKLDFSDPSYYRSILNSTLEPDEEPDLKQSAFAHTELEAHRRLEDDIQQELFHGEQTLLAFNQLIQSLEKSSSGPALDAALESLRKLA